MTPDQPAQPQPEDDNAPAAAEAWFSDEGTLLVELKQSRRALGAAPPIPGYTDLVELARGGQGVVYLATQVSTNRRVAIKVLRDRVVPSETARRRFEREIEVVASLRHPQIVRVYDSGSTMGPAACTYLVMEHIAGMPFDEFVRDRLAGLSAPSTRTATSAERRATIRALVELFATVCDGVKHAHQRGVIHRDLKPSNIRVDNDGVAHVLDFGLAKLHGDEIERNASAITATESGLFMGSLPWTSPEQAEGRNDAVDVRSDVYALGAILYQSLTGRTPSDVGGGLHAALTNITSVDPSPPRASNPAVDADLETIVLKCLAKEPDRRYQSAGDLGGDLRRWLAGEPIEARRASAWYAMRKRLRRYRLASAVAAVGALLFATAAGVAIWQALEARTQQQIAERRFDDVRALARTFLYDLHDAVVDLSGSQPARELLVTTALRYLDDLAAEQDPGRDLQLERANAYRRVGDIQGDPYNPNLGDTAGALASYRIALELAEGLLDDDPADLAALTVASEAQRSIGDVLLFQGDRDGSLERFAAALEMVNRLIELDDRALAHRRTLASLAIRRGDTLGYQGHWSEAKAEFAAALAVVGEIVADEDATDLDRRNLAVCHGKISFARRITSDVDGALESAMAALSISSALADEEPDNASRARAVNINHNEVGTILGLMGRADEALDHHTVALEIAERLAAADPRNALAQADLGFTLTRIGEVLDAAGRIDEAMPYFERTLELRSRLFAVDPQNASLRRDLCVAMFKVAHASGMIAADEARPPAERESAIRRSAQLFDECAGHLEAMERNGTLNEVDASLPAMVRGRAEAALAASVPGVQTEP